MCRVLESVMEGNNSGLGSAKKAARGSWTMVQKQQAVAESNVPGANVAEVAKRHGVRPALLSSWRRQLSSKVASPKKPAKFAAVRVAAAHGEGMIEPGLFMSAVRILACIRTRP